MEPIARFARTPAATRNARTEESVIKEHIACVLCLIAVNCVKFRGPILVLITIAVNMEDALQPMTISNQECTRQCLI